MRADTLGEEHFLRNELRLTHVGVYPCARLWLLARLPEVTQAPRPFFRAPRLVCGRTTPPAPLGCRVLSSIAMRRLLHSDDRADRLNARLTRVRNKGCCPS